MASHDKTVRVYTSNTVTLSVDTVTPPAKKSRHVGGDEAACNRNDSAFDATMHVRPYTSADRDEVVGPVSAGVYDDNDYLPARIDAWQSDPSKNILLCCDGPSKGRGRILGLDTVSWYDGGETVLMQALRVREDARGRGVAKRLAAAADDVIERRHVTGVVPKRARVTTGAGNAASIALHERQGYTQVGVEWRLPVQAFRVDPVAVSETPLVVVPELREVPSGMVVQLLAGLASPPPLVIFDWQAESPSPVTEARLRSGGVRFFATGNDISDASISFGGVTQWARGAQISATVHCGSKASHFRAHCRRWLEYGRQSGAIGLQIFHDSALPADCGARIVVEEAGVAFVSWIEFLKEEALVVLEKQF